MGAVSLDGRMIDAASIRQAEVVIEKMKQIEGTANNTEAVA
jgi:malyl-CoA/(S)-citramalyl-CoA lyase